MRRALCLLAAFAILLGGRQASIQAKESNGLCVVAGVKRPTIYAGILASWMEVGVTCDGVAQNLYLLNLSETQTVPPIGGACVFELRDGEVSEIVGDRLVERPQPARIIESFHCEQKTCIRLVENYVTETRGWENGSYEVREESSDLGGRGFSVWHESDRGPRAPGGGGKSFHLEVDVDCQKVIKELAYQ